MAAANELDFHISKVGRSLQSSATRTIGCPVPPIENPVYADAVQGAEEVCLDAGYQMRLICTNDNTEMETHAIRTLIAKQVDRIILTRDGHVLYTLPFIVRSILAVLVPMDLKTLEEGAASLGRIADGGHTVHRRV